jgi:DNA segregation ATPase FtsK/SpoIIIE, S-DNA-T family
VTDRGKSHTNRKYEILGVIILGITVFLFLALVTDGYRMHGAERRYLDGIAETPNLMGTPGAMLAGVLAILVGDAAHVIYALTFIWGVMLFTHRPVDRLAARFAGMLLLTCATAGLLQMDLAIGASNNQPGGAFGAFVADSFFVPWFGIVGANVVGITLLIIGTLLATDFLFVHVLFFLRKMLRHLFRGNLAIFEAARGIAAGLRARIEAWRLAWAARRQKSAEARKKREREKLLTKPGPARRAPAEKTPDRIRINTAKQEEEPAPFPDAPEITEPAAAAQTLVPAAVEPVEAAAAQTAEAAPPVMESGLLESENPAVTAGDLNEKARRKARRKSMEMEELPPDYEYPKNYTKPSMDILDEPETRVIPNLDDRLRKTGELLEETLLTFNIEAKVTDITRGPTITRFELEPAPGIKVSRFLSLSDDIALALRAQRVRVEAPIPGKGRVGIEVPNFERDPVLIRELLENKAYKRGKGHINLALGKDIAGEVRIADLATMPHLLVAGATGAGKTVCVKALLASLLFQHTPDELQLMLIDPKMVELSIFNDIPHLITPVVTEPKKAATALSWLINEMEERYRLFAELRVRNIEVYNQSVENGEIELEGEAEEDGANNKCVNVIRKLPYIVCIIDELADLMMLARSEVEDAIGRLAQLARAVGIHLIIATQRPSVDVLTGVIKANFPARVSFQVSSRVDSRCILDEIGAERLIGMGDMLYLPAGHSKPVRIQGAFVSDEEMNILIAHLKRQAPPQYRDEIENYGKKSDKAAEILDEEDPLLDEAIQVVLDTGQASISMVQRRLRVGYTRAARLIDMMELKGIVGPHTGSKAREILVNQTPEEGAA